MGIDVLASGSGWLVVGKPAGLAVHRSALVGDDPRSLVQEVRAELGVAVDPVHRLDKPTSGCLLLSSDRQLTSALQAALAGGEKRYLAFVRGRVAATEPIVFERPLTDSQGIVRDAVTVVEPIAGSSEPRCSVVVARPGTGRFHQIRRHLRDLSHPVLGDSTHGDTRVNRWWRETFGLGRLALHCLSLSLDGPEGRIEVSCPLPADLVGFGRQLPFWPQVVAGVPEVEGTCR